MKILVLGQKSFIGSHLPYPTLEERICPNRRVVNVEILDRHKPDVIVNCIGRTGSPNIDWCEQNKVETSITNTALPIMLAELCEEKNIKLIHIGSGCVFYGAAPNGIGWTENDTANPKSFYSKTKLAADLTINGIGNTCILRIRMPISGDKNPRNLLSKITKYRKVVMEYNSVSLVPDIVRAVDWAIAKDKTGIYNITSPDPISHRLLLEEYKKYNPAHEYESINGTELDSICNAARSNCVLDVSKAINEGFQFGDTYENTRACVREFCK